MRVLIATVVLVAALVPAMVAGAAVYDTTVVSVSGDQRGGSSSGPGVAISEDGTRIAFESSANNLNSGDDDAVVNI